MAKDYNGKEKAMEWLDRLSKSTEPVVAILSTHLYTENCINHLIMTKTNLKEELIKNINWTFSTKLTLVYEIGLIPEWLFKNIRLLNTLRNLYAHNLNAKLLEANLNFHDPEKKVEICDFQKSEVKNKMIDEYGSEDAYFINVIACIATVTYFPIHNIIIKMEKES